MNTKYTGALTDIRSQVEKEKDWQHSELFGAGVYEWKDFDESKIPKFTIRNQNGSGMCGAFSSVKALGINNFYENNEYVDLDPRFIYNLRSNKGEGMYMSEMFKIACDYGAPLDTKLSGDNLSEMQASKYVITDTVKKEAIKYKGKNYLFVDKKDLDSVAKLIDQGYTPIILLRCNIKEWTAEPYISPEILPKDYNVNHYVPLIYAGKRNGVKTFVCSDSWGSSYGKNGLRYISEDFMLSRVESVGYIIDLPNEKPTDIVKYNFTRTLIQGMSGDDVQMLQKILYKEGFFPTSETTKYYGAITAAAVLKYQLKYNIDTVEALKKLGGKSFGPKSIAFTNKKYGQ